MNKARFTRYIIFSNIFIAICAAALTAEVFFFFNILSLHYWYIAFVFFGTIFIYNLHYARKKITDTTDERQFWLLRNKKHTNAMFLFSIIGMAGLVARYWQSLISFQKNLYLPLIFLFAIIGILSIAYSHPFSLLGIKAIRHKGKIKLLYLSAVWTFTTAVMPVLFNMGQTYSLFQLQFIFFTLHRFIFIAALSFIFNIYDISEDKENNISTFAVMAGQQKSLMTGKWLFTLLYICLSITLLLTLSSVYFFIILAILLPAPIIYFAYNNFNSRMPESTFALLYDGLMIVKALLLIFAVTVSKH